MTATLIFWTESQAPISAFSAQVNFAVSQVKTFAAKGIESISPSPSKLMLKESRWGREYMEGFQNFYSVTVLWIPSHPMPGIIIQVMSSQPKRKRKKQSYFFHVRGRGILPKVVLLHLWEKHGHYPFLQQNLLLCVQRENDCIAGPVDTNSKLMWKTFMLQKKNLQQGL